MTRRVTLVVVCCLVCGLRVSASNWERFRGPNGTGVSTDRRLPTDIDRDKGVVWSVKLPKGNSSPMVVNGRIYLTGHEGDQRFVLCVDAATGQERWRRSLPRLHEDRFHSSNGPTTPTPTTDGRRIFVYLPEVGLLGFDRDGRELWRVPLGPFASVHGMASSPVYVAGRVVLLVDTPMEAFLVAFEPGSGRQVWRTERPPGTMGTFTTPTVARQETDRAQVIVAGAEELTGYLAATGERVWWARGVSMAPNAPPFVTGDSVYSIEPPDAASPGPFSDILKQFDANQDRRITRAEVARDLFWSETLKGLDVRRGNADGAVTEDEWMKAAVKGDRIGGLVRTRLGGTGDVTATHVVWRYDKGLPYLTAALLYEGVLYSIRNGTLTTFSPETGALLKQKRLMNALGEYYASPIAGDGKIYFVSIDGQVTVVKAGAEWEILSTGDLQERVVATPAISDGRVYIRTDSMLYCFGEPRKRS
jgi:outer membrane protein assembly factor BamB